MGCVGSTGRGLLEGTTTEQGQRVARSSNAPVSGRANRHKEQLDGGGATFSLKPIRDYQSQPGGVFHVERDQSYLCVAQRRSGLFGGVGNG